MLSKHTDVVPPSSDLTRKEEEETKRDWSGRLIGVGRLVKEVLPKVR